MWTTDGFEEFWAAYPARAGGRGKARAREKFREIIKEVWVDDLINGARAYERECAKLKQIGTQYVAMAATWLNQRRWEDYADTPPQVEIGDCVGNYVWTGSRWKPNEG